MTFIASLVILAALGAAPAAHGYSLAPISGRIISYVSDHDASHYKLSLELDCVKTVFGFPKSCGVKSVEVAIQPDGNFMTPELALPGFMANQYNLRFALIDDAAPGAPALTQTYLGIDNNNAGDFTNLLRDLKVISIHRIPRIQLVFSLRSGRSAEEFLRGPQFQTPNGPLPFCVSDVIYEVAGKTIARGESGKACESSRDRRALDRYFIGDESVYALGLDAQPRDLAIHLYGEMPAVAGKTGGASIDHSCRADSSSCRVMIDDPDGR